MCDVHLIELSREISDAVNTARCSYCNELIEGQGTLITGYLDDGTPGTLVFAYHEDCVWDMEHDTDAIKASGCFDYGTPLT